jgi:hypothetical protein
MINIECISLLPAVRKETYTLTSKVKKMKNTFYLF